MYRCLRQCHLGSKGGNKETDADILRGEVLDTMVALGIPRENADTISSSDNFLKAIINLYVLRRAVKERKKELSFTFFL